MTAATMTLAEFLLARIAEDEAAARAAQARNGEHWTARCLGGAGSDVWRIDGTVEPSHPRAYSGDLELWDDEGALGMYGETAEHIARHDPARVLAECEVKRRIVDRHSRCDDVSFGDSSTCPDMRDLAAIHGDHLDYRDEWRY